MALPRPLLVIVGPTGSGKSALSLALAERYSGEVVSADSVQVYRHFDIGSGKLSVAERRGIAHHGLDVIEPEGEMDASLFGNLAHEWIGGIRERGHLPIVCGGTFLWIRSLVHGLVPAPPKDEALRLRHKELVDRLGRPALHRELERVDAPSAQRLNPNDFVRVSRALEVFEKTGVPLSVFQQGHAFATERHRAVYVGIDHGSDLAERIARRVDQMLQQGLVEEVEGLCTRGYRDTRPMSSVGYRQVLSALDANDAAQRASLPEDIARAHRIFSRRQRTWLRDRAVTWLSKGQAERAELPDAVLSLLGV